MHSPTASRKTNPATKPVKRTRYVYTCGITFAVLLTSFVSMATEVTTTGEMLSSANQEIRNINTDQLQSLIRSNPEVRLIDVRTESEIATLGGTIDAGLRPLNINRGWLEFRVEDAIPDKDAAIVVYCGINQRSPLAARTLSCTRCLECYWRDTATHLRELRTQQQPVFQRFINDCYQCLKIPIPQPGSTHGKRLKHWGQPLLYPAMVHPP